MDAVGKGRRMKRGSVIEWKYNDNHVTIIQLKVHVVDTRQCCQIVNKVHKFMNIPPFAELVYELQSIYELSMNIHQFL